MADRTLTVTILGDSRDLEKAFSRSTRATQKFSQQVKGGGITNELRTQTQAVRGITAAEEELIKVRSRRASSFGPLRFAGVGLAAGVGLFAATQLVRELGDRLEVTGDAAFTTQGRLRNMVSELTSGNLVGAVESLTRVPKTIEELGISTVDARGRLQALQQVAEGTTTTLLQQTLAAGDQREGFKQLSDIYKEAGTSSVDLAQKLLDAIATEEVASAATNALADSAARLGQQFLTAAGVLVTFKGAVDDLPGLRGPGARAFETPHTRTTRESIGPLSPSQRRELGLIGQEGTARIGGLQDRLNQLNNQIKAGNINQQQRLTILTNIKQTEAEIAAIYSDQAAAQKAAGEAAAREAEAAAREAKAARERALQAAKEAAQRRIDARNARQFFALGLSPTGGERTPNIAGLKRQLGNFADSVKGTFLDTKKTRSLMATIRKILAGGMGKVSEDVRSTVRDLLRDLNQQLKGQTEKTGNETKWRTFNKRALLRAAGLDPDEVKRVSFALSRVGAGGTTPGRGTGAFGFALPGGGVIHNTVYVTLDGKTLEAPITRQQQIRARGNPTQKRGPTVGKR